MSDVSVKALIFPKHEHLAPLKVGKWNCAGFKIHLPGFASGPELTLYACQLSYL